MRTILLFWMSTYLMSHSNCSLSSEQPKSVVQAWPMVNLWNFSMSMTPTWATAHPNSSGRWFTQAAERKHSQTHHRLIYLNLSEILAWDIVLQPAAYTPTSRPPLEPPLMVSLEGEVYPSLTRYSAAHWKSVKQFCLLANMPAKGEKYKVCRQFISITEYILVPLLENKTISPHLCARSPRTLLLPECWQQPGLRRDVWQRWVGIRCSSAWWRC